MLDPSRSTTMEQAETIPNIFETLTRDLSGRIVPWLASEFHLEDGGRRYRFRLRDDVRFHDGRRLSARDVRYTFERLLQNPDNDARWFYRSMRGAQAVLNGECRDLTGFRIHSANEFTIELEESVSIFPALVSYHASAILPEGSDPSEEGWTDRCAGTGPFRVVKFEPGRRLELERNKSYWRKGFPRSEGLVFSFGVAPKDILEGFRAGRFSVASDLLPADVEALRRDPEFASGYREAPRLITYYAVFNCHRGPLSNIELRRRLIAGVDVGPIVRQTLGRLAVPAYGLIPPGLLGHDSTTTVRSNAVFSEKVTRQSDLELTCVLNPVYFGEFSALARELEKVFSERGVKIRRVNNTMSEWLDAVKSSSADIVVGRWSADYSDAHTFVNVLHTRDGFLGALSGSEEIDRLIERGQAETSPAVRHSIYRQIEEIIARDAIMLPLFHEQSYRFARPELEGLTLTYATTAVDYKNLRLRG